MKGDHLGLIMLPVKNKSYIYESIEAFESSKKHYNKEVGGLCNQKPNIA
jgi:hypothetical protein